MSPPAERRADRLPSNDGAAQRGSGGGRRLRVKRSAAPLRLIESGGGGGGDGPRLDLSGPAPLTLMRLGRQDLEAGLIAVSDARRPTAVVTGLSESRETTRRARRLARAKELPWLADPLLFQTGLSGYRTRAALDDLDYTPGRDGEPYRSEEFFDLDLVRRVGRSSVGAQIDLLSAGAIGGAFVVSRIDDPWLEVNQRLLRASSEAAAAWDVPLIATLPIRLSGFDGVESQRLLVRSLMARRPAAWLLMVDGLSSESSVQRTVSALRLAIALQAASAPVILARAGDLRRLAWSIGVAGAEFGLGRMLRFSVPDFTRSAGGPGPTPGPRMEMGSLGGSMGFAQARAAIESELVAEADCGCPACEDAGSLDARMAAVAAHDAHHVLEEAAALASRSLIQRVGDLDDVLRHAWTTSSWLDHDQPGARVRAQIDHRRQVLDAALEAGLLEPVRVLEQLGLAD